MGCERAGPARISGNSQCSALWDRRYCVPELLQLDNLRNQLYGSALRTNSSPPSYDGDEQHHPNGLDGRSRHRRENLRKLDASCGVSLLGLRNVEQFAGAGITRCFSCDGSHGFEAQHAHWNDRISLPVRWPRRCKVLSSPNFPYLKATHTSPCAASGSRLEGAQRAIFQSCRTRLAGHGVRQNVPDMEWEEGNKLSNYNHLVGLRGAA